MTTSYERERRARIAANRRAAAAPVRKYPCDVPTGTKVYVSALDAGGRKRQVVGELVKNEKRGGAYLVEVLADGDTYHWVQSANRKLDVVKGQGIR